MTELAAYLKGLRPGGKPSLREIARRCNLTAAFLSKVERGAHQSFRVETLREIAKGYGVRAEKVLALTGLPEEQHPPGTDTPAQTRYGIRPRDWLPKALEYRGVGRAEFDDPKGYLEGPTTVTVSARGEVQAAMDVERIYCERDLRFGLIEFLNRDKPTQTEKGWSLSYSGRRNPCTRVLVECEDGSFVTTGSVSYNHSSFPGANTGQVRFSSRRAQFDVSRAAAGKFWVVPLANFVSDLSQSHPKLDRHPLRVYPTPLLPSDLDAKEKLRAELYRNQRNRLMVFEVNGKLGFIEMLPDYATVRKQLESREVQQAVTSVMVGEIEDRGFGADVVESLFETLWLLGLATGNEVGAPWIELRDADGHLVSRLHRRIVPHPYEKGRAAIDEGVSPGVGRLLSRALSSPDFGKDYLQVVMINTIRGDIRSSWHAENMFSYLIRAIECLGKHFKLGSRDLLAGAIAETADATRAALADANSRILALAAGKAEPVAHGLKRIGRKVRSAVSSEATFGEIVTALLDRFDLQDIRVLEAHYAQNPRSDKRSWPELLTKLRGALVHEGYFRVSDGTIQMDDLVTVGKHLHDILVRVVLKILEYDGAYQPTVLVWTSPQTIDWVTLATPAARLGYGFVDEG